MSLRSKLFSGSDADVVIDASAPVLEEILKW
jgi:hypothetical protein